MSFSCKLVLLVCAIMVHSKASGTPVRKTDTILSKRNLNNFGHMIECETKGDKWKYNGYGCWCGLGGAGPPLDGMDRCCYDHDKCYDRLIEDKTSNCTTTVDPYVVSYKFSKCSDCALASDYGVWDWLGWVTVQCRMAICACDSAAAKCFANNVYNNAYASYDKSKCKDRYTCLKI